MSDRETFSRAEWGMYLDVPKAECVSCLCYELTRSWISDRRKNSLKWNEQSEEWARTFTKPYLLLSREERNKVSTEFFPTFHGKKLTNFIKSNRTKSPTQIAKEVEFWLSLQGNFGTGRASVLARVGRGLKYLGAYRICQRYRWNQLPSEPDIVFFSNQREWLKAQTKAKRLIDAFCFIVHDLCDDPEELSPVNPSLHRALWKDLESYPSLPRDLRKDLES
jgi:hypothetical protein